MSISLKNPPKSVDARFRSRGAEISQSNTVYTLGTPIPVVERGHEGCGVHTWHSGTETFDVVLSFGENVEIDPPKVCSGCHR